MYVSFLFLSHNSTPTEIYTLSLHDALPIFEVDALVDGRRGATATAVVIGRRFLGTQPDRAEREREPVGDRKSTRLNSSHRCISYAVFCLKKKKKILTRSSV